MTTETKSLLLLAPDEAVTGIVEGIVLDHDLSLQTAYDWDDALRILFQSKPMAFIFSLNVLARGGAQHIHQLKAQFPEVPLMAIRHSNYSEDVLSLMQAGLYACLAEEHLAQQFAYNLVKLVASQTGTYNPMSLLYEERLLLIPNDFSLVLQIAKTLVECSIPLSDKSRFHFILGLSEIITNAIEHGNLGITYEEKTHALKASRFFALALERTDREPFKNRVVTIRCRILPHLKRIEYFVADQGLGFDWRHLHDPRSEANLLSRHGRGILMARHAFDEVNYNEQGNEVTLVVKLDVPQGKRL